MTVILYQQFCLYTTGYYRAQTTKFKTPHEKANTKVNAKKSKQKHF